MRVSNTMVQTWMSCALQAKFKYKDHLPTKRTSRMTFGIVVHATLEHYNITGDIDSALAMFEDLWDNPEKVNAEIEIWPPGTTHGGFRQKGLEMLRSYHDKNSWDDRIILAQEHKFLVPFGEHELTGVVDLLEMRKSGRGKNTVRIVDYKTGSKKPYKNTLRLNTQFTIYDYASRQPEFWLGNKHDFNKYPPIASNAREAMEAYGKLPRRGIYFHLLGGSEIDVGPREDADFMRLYRVVKEISRAWEQEIFVPTLSGDSCVFCDFTEPCGIKIPEREYPDDDEAWF